MGIKTKKTKYFALLFDKFIVSVFIIFVLFAIGKWAFFVFKQSGYFAVKDIWYESTLKSIESTELSNLKGKNLFDIDLQKIQSQLQRRYPQYRQLMVLKRFPDQILVVAKKRSPLAQAKIKGRQVALDGNGIVLSTSGDFEDNLPLITGIHTIKGNVQAGAVLESEDLRLALNIIKMFKAEKSLSSYRISKIDIANLSEIYFYILDNLRIVIDQEDVGHQLQLLGLVLSQAKIDTNKVRYVDLRFKEPILGKR